MPGAATQAMSARIVEELRHRVPRAAAARGARHRLPPRASISPRKPHARDPCYDSDRLLVDGNVRAMSRTVVVSGIGLVSAFGVTAESYRDGLLSGRSAV